MKLLTQSFFMLLFTSQVCGQTIITGAIKDDTGAPVRYATVTLFTSDSSVVTGVTSLEAGEFSIAGQPDGDYVLTVSYLGYEKVSCPVNVPGKCQLGDIMLKQKIAALKEVEVHPEMIRRKADGYFFNPAGSSIVTGRNTLELLQFAPGVWFNQAGLSINGKGGTRVMVNDRMLNLSGEDLKAYLENINAEQIQSVEVIPESGAQYDAASQGGILKITLKREKTAGLTGAVSMTMSGRDELFPGLLRPGLNLDYRRNKLSLYANVGYTESHYSDDSKEYTRYLTGNMREVDNRRKYTADPTAYTGRVGSVYEINDKHSVGADFDFNILKTGGKSVGGGSTKVGEVTSVIASLSASDINSDYYGVSANYKFKADDKGSGLIVVGDYMTSRTTSFEKNYSTETPPTGIVSESGLNTDMRYSSDLYTARADYKHVFTDKLQLEAGAKYAYTHISTKLDNLKLKNGSWQPDDGLNDDYLYREGVAAGYVNGTADLGRFSVVAGLRVENTDLRPKSYMHPEKVESHNYTNLFPTLRGLYYFNKDKGHIINAGYTRRINRPSFQQLMPFRVQQNNYTYTVGNPGMKPSYINNYSLAGTIFNKYSLSLSIEDIKDAVNQMVVVDPDDPNILLYQQANIDRVTGFYLSLNIPFQPAKWWQAWLDVTYWYKKNRMKEFSNNGGSVVARLNNSVTYGKGWSSDITYEYNSGGATGNVTTKGYNTVNVNLKRNFFDNKLTLMLYVVNITDSRLRFKIENPGEFVKNLHSYQSGMARTYGISLRWNFRAGKEVKVQKAIRGNEEERARQ